MIERRTCAFPRRGLWHQHLLAFPLTRERAMQVPVWFTWHWSP